MEAKSVKRFERSNGLDTALHKKLPFLPCGRYRDGHHNTKIMRQLGLRSTKQSNPILAIQCLSTCNIRLYQFLAHCQAQAPFMRACHANGFFSRTLVMTADAMFAPYKSRIVSTGGSLRPLTYLPRISVEKIKLPGQDILRPGTSTRVET